MSEVKRYDLVERVRGMESWSEIQEQRDGDYVLFSDFDLATKARDGVFSQVVKTLTQERDMALCHVERLASLVDAKRMEAASDMRRMVEDYDRLAAQLKLCEQHAHTMATDFDASISVVKADRDGHAEVAQKRAAQIRTLEDAMEKSKAWSIAAGKIIENEFAGLDMDREQGPMGEVCRCCGAFVGEFWQAKNHSDSCSLLPILSKI